MVYPVSLMFDILSIADILLGIVVNLFVAFVNIASWSRGRKLKACDKILIGLGTSRFFLDNLLLCGIIIRFLNWDSSTLTQRWLIQMFVFFFDFSSVWFAAWLCIYYYVKVTIFKNSIFLRIKLRMPQYILHVISASALISFIAGLLYAWDNRQSRRLLSYNVYLKRNRSYEALVSLTMPCLFFGHLLPFIMVTVTSSLLIGTILVHVKHLTTNITSFTTPSMNAHMSAIRSVCLLEFISIVYLIFNIVILFSHPTPVMKHICFFIIYSYPTFHTMVLIVGNSNLRKTMLRLLHYFKTFHGASDTSQKPDENMKGRTVA